MEIKANKNLNILLQVCDYTGYEVGFENNEIVCKDTYGSKKILKYNNIEDALIGWLPTMEEQQEGLEEEVDMWSKEISYVKKMKKEIDTKKFLYDNLDLKFYGNTYDDGFGLSCEFKLVTPIKPMIKSVDLMHYMDSNNIVSEGYVEFTEGRVEMDEDTEEIKIWIFEPSMSCGGVFLHETKMINYNPLELQEEIIKRWNEYGTNID